MALYMPIPSAVFPSGTINYQFCHDNGIDITEKVNQAGETTSSNFAISIVSSIYAKVALFYINSNISVVVGAANHVDSWNGVIAMGLSWWGSHVNSYYPTNIASYSDFWYGYNIGSNNGYSLSETAPLLHVFSDLNSALSDMDDGIWDYAPTTYPITYRLTNVTTTGPNEAAVGDTVTIPLTFPEGYGVVNPPTDAYVTCNGVIVPSTYSDRQLVFTMPDPS